MYSGLSLRKMIARAVHKDRPNDPVLDKGKSQDLLVIEHVPYLIVTDFGERRVHHEDETDCDRNIGRPDGKLFQEGCDPRHKSPARTPTAIARNIHNVSQRSRKERRWVSIVAMYCSYLIIALER